MLSKGKGKIAGIILAKLKEKDSAKADAPSKDKDKGLDEGLESIAEELVSCLKRGDAEGVAKALCDFIDAHESSCMQDEGSEGEDEDY